MYHQSTFGFDSLQLSPLEDFYRRVDRPRNPNACWLWKGRSLTGDGYGQIMRGRKRYMAHRYSFLLHYGYLPEDKNVCHTCDTPLCVNPKHLFLGTQADNMHDRDRKGRGTNFVPKLTNEQVQQIRELRAAGVPQSAVAQRFGVRQPTISYIDSGRIWKGTPRGRPRLLPYQTKPVVAVRRTLPKMLSPLNTLGVDDVTARALVDARRFHQARDGRLKR